MALIVNPATTEDIEMCAVLMSSSSPWKDFYFSIEQCQSLLRAPGLQVHCAHEGTQLTAFLASLSRNVGGEPMIEYVCVQDDYRNQGIGTQLIQFFEDRLFPEADNLFMFVSDINPKALSLYQRLGYVVVGQLPNYNLPGQTEFLIRKSRRPRQLKYKP